MFDPYDLTRLLDDDELLGLLLIFTPGEFASFIYNYFYMNNLAEIARTILNEPDCMDRLGYFIAVVFDGLTYEQSLQLTGQCTSLLRLRFQEP